MNHIIDEFKTLELDQMVECFYKLHQIKNDAKKLQALQHATNSLNEMEAFVWNRNSEVEILVAKTDNSCISAPISPEKYFKLSLEQQKVIQDMFDKVSTFSPATVGSQLRAIFRPILVNDEGDRYIKCKKCKRENDPNWSDCSC